jgi:hypothetical protein
LYEFINLIKNKMSPDEFIAILKKRDVGDIVDEYIITNDSGPNVKQDALKNIEVKLRETFQFSQDVKIEVIVVGSAKLGFSIMEKSQPNKGFQPRYRSYRPGKSDIDIAIVSANLYGRLWSGLARHGAAKRDFPWRIGDLSDYMLHGWIRPDKFPADPPQEVKDWETAISDIQKEKLFRYLKPRFALYQSRFFLKTYQMRGVRDAQRAARFE